jgi:site-specific recombinase XerD
MAERLDDLFTSFARDLRAAQKAERTIDVYGQSVRFYSAWLADRGRPVTTESLTKYAVSTWLAELNEEGKSAATVLTYYKGLRRFVRWLLAEGEITDDPMKNLEQPNPPPVPVPIITDEEIAALIKTCDGRTFVARRDEAMIRVLFDCGLRIAELAKIEVDDVDFDHDVLYVMGKGSKPRAVPFSAKTGRALDRYRRIRKTHRHAEESGWWLGQRGALSTDGIDNILRVRAGQAGVKNLHAHRFRHTFAHDWLANGGQERDLMRLAGWSSDAMLSRYGASAATERAHAAARRLKRGDRI